MGLSGLVIIIVCVWCQLAKDKKPFFPSFFPVSFALCPVVSCSICKQYKKKRRCFVSVSLSLLVLGVVFCFSSIIAEHGKWCGPFPKNPYFFYLGVVFNPASGWAGYVIQITSVCGLRPCLAIIHSYFCHCFFLLCYSVTKIDLYAVSTLKPWPSSVLQATVKKLQL